jgi:AcrR family transcriptional regulator
MRGATARPTPRRGARTDPEPPPRRGKTERGQRTRLKLIRAAEKVFGDVGFYDARISEITREAGVAAGTFYLYFDSKEELLRALIRAINHDLRRALTEGTEHLPHRVDAETRGFEIFFYEFLPKHRKLYRIIKQAEFADPPLFEWYYRHLARGYARRLQTAMDAGELRRWDADLAACALMGIADFVAMRYVSWGRGLPRPKLDELMEFIRAGLAADGVARPVVGAAPGLGVATEARPRAPDAVPPLPLPAARSARTPTGRTPAS